MLGTVLGLLGAAASYGLNYSNTQSQNQWNLQQWMRENQYNLPVNQVSRLRQAGLNPALMYQNGTGSLQAAQSPDLKGVPALDPLTFSQIQLNQSQSDSIRDANERENQKQGLTLQTLEETRLQIKEQTNLLKKEQTKTRWETQYLRSLNNSEKTRGSILFNEWYSGYKTLQAKINYLLESYPAQGLYEKANANYRNSEYNWYSQLMATNVATQMSMQSLNASASWNNYAQGSAALSNAATNAFNADTNRMNAYTNAWNSDTYRQQTYSNLQKIYLECLDLKNQLDIFDETRFLQVAKEYTGVIGSIFGGRRKK